MEFDFSVPCGSCAGPILYFVYARALQGVVDNALKIHGFADDHTVKNEFEKRK